MISTQTLTRAVLVDLVRRACLGALRAFLVLAYVLLALCAAGMASGFPALLRALYHHIGGN